MTHEIELEGYYPKILGSPMRMLCLGTKASYGMEVLHFRRGTGWDGLALDGGGVGVALLGEGLQNGGGKPQITEIHT